MDENGNWVEDKVQLKELAARYYIELFSSNPQTGGDYIRGRFSNLNDDARLFLKEEYIANEVHKALKTMGSLKALGPDGYQAVLYKKTWSTTGPEVTSFVLGC